MLSKKEKLNIVAAMMQNHEQLCPDVFNPDGILKLPVREKLMDLVQFVKKGFLECFSHLSIQDITLNGSLCSYVYSDISDIDLFIIVGGVFPGNDQLTLRVLDGINMAFSAASVRPLIFGHSVDYGVLGETNFKINKFNCYSVLSDQWKQRPIRKEFVFTPEELYQAYCRYSSKLHQFVADLPKTADGFLTGDSCIKLQKFLQNLREQAFFCKENSPEHEYGLEYNLYRLLKKFGAWRHFRQYITDSYKNSL